MTTAIKLAIERNKTLVPTVLGDAQLREVFVNGVALRSQALARVSHGYFLSELKRAIIRHMQAGRGASLPQTIAFLQRVLQQIGYTPETGFPGDDALGIPPAEPGSLQDLSSWSRLKLIIETEVAMASGQAEKMQGSDKIAMKLFPAYELVRIETRRVPRGSIDSGSTGWAERWHTLGGPDFVHDVGNHSTRMIAMKTDPIWRKLGDSSLYRDALDVDFPPFAIRSGMGWKPISRGECERLGLGTQQPGDAPAPTELVTVPARVPEPATISPDIRAKIRAQRERLQRTLDERGRVQLAA